MNVCVCTDPIAAVDVEAAESGRAARLEALAGDLIAVGEVEMHQLSAKGEHLRYGRVADARALVEYERVQLAAALGHLEQTRLAQIQPTTTKNNSYRFAREVCVCVCVCV